MWIVFGASVVIAIFTLVISQLTQPEPPPGMGPMYPRTPAPPRSVSMHELLRLMGIGALTWYACILSAPLFIVLGRRLPFDRHRWLVSLLAHLAVIIVILLATSLLQHTVTYAGALSKPPLSTYLQVAVLTGLLPFAAVAATTHALVAQFRARAGELEATRMKGQLAEARLAALTAQLQPHFLFNTLQGISALIPRDPAAADRMLANLSDLLREVLQRGEKREVTLDEELRVLEPYLEISRTRFGERLNILVQIEGDSGAALVPFFILQPLVENALAHGIGHRAGTGSVEIRARRTDQRLLLTVVNDGHHHSLTNGEGIGLPNTRARLDELYGDDYVFRAAPVESGGFEARIELPFRTA